MVFALLHSGSGTESPDNICEGVNQDGLPVRFMSTMSGGFYQCLLLGEFATSNAAGIAAVGCANGVSIAENREYSGNVYRTSKGKFSFTVARSGDSANLRLTLMTFRPAHSMQAVTTPTVPMTQSIEAKCSLDPDVRMVRCVISAWH